MDLDRLIHPLVDIPDTDDTKYDKWGRVSMVKKNGVWNLKTHKDLKNSTPDGNMNAKIPPMFSKGDLVKVKCNSIYGVPVDGTLYFDSYDSWDNTCFVSYDPKGKLCYWMNLSDLTIVVVEKT